jgi:hypothetical protein
MIKWLTKGFAMVIRASHFILLEAEPGTKTIKNLNIVMENQ